MPSLRGNRKYEIQESQTHLESKKQQIKSVITEKDLIENKQQSKRATNVKNQWCKIMLQDTVDYLSIIIKNYMINTFI